MQDATWQKKMYGSIECESVDDIGKARKLAEKLTRSEVVSGELQKNVEGATWKKLMC